MKKKILITSIMLIIFVVIFFFFLNKVNYNKLNKVYITSGTKEKGLYYNYENKVLKTKINYGDIKIERKLKIDLKDILIKEVKKEKLSTKELKKDYVLIRFGKKNYYSKNKKFIKRLEVVFEKVLNDNYDKVKIKK